MSANHNTSLSSALIAITNSMRAAVQAMQESTAILAQLAEQEATMEKEATEEVEQIIDRKVSEAITRFTESQEFADDVAGVIDQKVKELNESLEGSIEGKVRIVMEEDVKDMVADIVEEKLNDFDFGDAIKDALDDFSFDRHIESTLEDFDMTDAVKNALCDIDISRQITHAFDEYDFTKDVEDALGQIDMSNIIRDALQQDVMVTDILLDELLTPAHAVSSQTNKLVNAIASVESFKQRVRDVIGDALIGGKTDALEAKIAERDQELTDAHNTIAARDRELNVALETTRRLNEKVEQLQKAASAIAQAILTGASLDQPAGDTPANDPA